MRKLFVKLFGVAALLANSTAADTLNFCFDPYPPYTFGSEGPAAGGLKVEVLMAVIDRIEGLEATVTLLPWRRCQQETEQGNFDGILPLFRNDEREGYMAFTHEVSAERYVFFYRPAQFPDGLPFDGTFEQMEGLRLGMLTGSYITDGLDEAFDEAAVTRARDVENLLNLLVAERVDIIATNEVVGNYYVTLNDLSDGIATAEVPISERVSQFGLSRASGATQHLEAFNLALAELHEERAIEAILSQAMPSQSE